jgi:phosphate transport system permease protein
MRDRLLSMAVILVAASVALVFVGIVGDLIWHGASHLSWRFITDVPENSGRAGGVSSILVSTLLVLVVALSITVPVGLACAVWLSEFARMHSRFRGAISLGLDILAGVPSIVFGLFGNAFFCIYLGLGFSILSGGLTLACMMMPIFVRTTEVGLSANASEWRLNAAALGMTKLSLIWHVLIPAAAPAIAAGLILSIGRASAETAALIFTSGYVDRMPSSLMDSGRTLAVHIFDLSMNVTGGDAAAYASALVLIGVIMVVNALALFISQRWLAGRVMPR